MAERVWDRFLTEQDKATLVGKGERKIGFGERPALLLIDLYRWVFGDKPEPVVDAIKTWPGSCGLAGWNALPSIQKTSCQGARGRHSRHSRHGHGRSRRRALGVST